MGGDALNSLLQGFWGIYHELMKNCGLQEAFRALQAQTDGQETSNTKAEKVETSEERRDAKSQVKRQGKERKKTAKASEKTQGGTNQSKPTRQRLADSQSGDQTGEKDDPVTDRTLKAKPKTEAAARKPTKPAAQTRAEGRESKSQESKPAVRERIRAPGKPKTVASQPKNQTEAGEEAPNAGLRRSKRIASRR